MDSAQEHPHLSSSITHLSILVLIAAMQIQSLGDDTVNSSTVKNISATLKEVTRENDFTSVAWCYRPFHGPIQFSLALCVGSLGMDGVCWHQLILCADAAVGDCIGDRIGLSHQWSCRGWAAAVVLCGVGTDWTVAIFQTYLNHLHQYEMLKDLIADLNSQFLMVIARTIFVG